MKDRSTQKGALVNLESPIIPDERREVSEQSLTTSPTLRVVGWVHSQMLNQISMEFQMTVRTTLTQITRKQASILLMCLVVRSTIHGVDVSMYLALEYLLTLLVRNGHRPEEVKDERERRTVMLAELILTFVRGNWITLSDREKLPVDLVNQIVSTGWLPNQQTLGSWKQYYVPEKFLEFRIVPLETLMDRNDKTEPYSSYTKGYGNGGQRSRTTKTRPSAELDGEDFEDLIKIPLEDFETFTSILAMLEQAKAERRQRRRE